MPEKKPFIVTLFFTTDISLELWDQTGLLHRELTVYRRLANKNLHFQLLTYGSSDDRSISTGSPYITVLPIYERLPFSPNPLLRLLLSFFIPVLFSNELRRSSLFKSNQMWGSHVALLSKILFKKPLLLRLGFDYAYFSRKANQSLFRQLFTHVYSAISFHLSSRVHLPTNADLLRTKRLYHLPSRKLFVIPNWIDTKAFSPTPEVRPYPANYLLFVGRLNPQKNLPLLIHAIANTSYQLHVYGDGPQRALLEELSTKLGSEVVFHSPVPNSLLPSIYNKYQLFVLPSLYEGLPKVLLEAMSCGLLVLANKSDGITDVVSSGENGLLFDNTVSSLQDSLFIASTSAQNLSTLSANARSLITRRYNLDKIISQEYNSYMSLVRRLDV